MTNTRWTVREGEYPDGSWDGTYEVWRDDEVVAHLHRVDNRTDEYAKELRLILTALSAGEGLRVGSRVRARGSEMPGTIAYAYATVRWDDGTETHYTGEQPLSLLVPLAAPAPQEERSALIERRARTFASFDFTPCDEDVLYHQRKLIEALDLPAPPAREDVTVAASTPEVVQSAHDCLREHDADAFCEQFDCRSVIKAWEAGLVPGRAAPASAPDPLGWGDSIPCVAGCGALNDRKAMTCSNCGKWQRPPEEDTP